MKAFLRNLLYSGIRDELATEDQVKLLFINSIIFFGAAVLIYFGVRDLGAGNLVLGWASLVLVGTILVVFFGIRITKNYRLGAWFIPTIMFLYFSYLSWSGGSGSTGVLWSLTYPLIGIFLLGARVGGTAALVFFAVQLSFLFIPGLSLAQGLEIEFKLRLAGVYVIIISFSMAFEVIRMRAQNVIDRSRTQLLMAKSQTDGILRNVKEGIFLLDKELVIGEQHSTSLGNLLDLVVPAGSPFLDAFYRRLSDREVSGIRDYLEMFFQPSPPWDLLQEINPLTEAALQTPDGAPKHLEFSFSPVELEEGRRILGTVRDVTVAFDLENKLKEEEDRAARQMRHLFQIIHVKPELLVQFLTDAVEEIGAINRKLKDPAMPAGSLVNLLFQGIHAVKGNAALVGLSDFSRKVHEIETFVAGFRDKEPVWKDFLDMTVRLSIIQAELNEIQDLMDRMATFQKELEASGTDSRDLLALTLRKAVDKLGRETEKDVHLDLGDFRGTDLPPAHRKLVKDILVQFLRNSFIHGLETPQERRAANKSSRCLIRVTTAVRDGRFALMYLDDGKGLSAAVLRESARGSGAFRDQDLSAWPDAKVLALIFHPGFSTAERADEHAGRGVGLGLVKTRVEAAGGVLKMRTTVGKGLAFDIELPMP